jgi:zinc finger protein
MTMNQTEYSVDHFGSVLMSVSVCQKCGYKHTDVLTLEKREPIAITARIRSIEDLSIHVIKSGTATISIPEFCATITPGPYSEGYISNVEGVLGRVEDALTFMLSSAKGKSLKKGESLLKQIRMAREKKPRFTLEIKGSLGNSALVSPDPTKIHKRKLSKRELLTVKFGQFALIEDKVQQQ